MSEILFVDDRLLPAEKAVVPAIDRAVIYGFGLFETLRAVNGIPFRLDDHLTRMKASARRFGIPTPWTAAKLRPWIAKLCAANGLEDCSVRVTATGGRASAPGRLIMRSAPLSSIPASWRRRGAPVRLATWSRDPAAPLYGHKTLNYLENVLVREEGRRSGYADTIFVAPDGRLLEGTVSNLFIVKGGRLLTPELKGVLPGVARRTILEIARQLGIRTEEGPIRAAELPGADESFISNVLIEVLPLGRLGAKRLKGPGEVTRRIAQDYRALIARSADARRARPGPRGSSGRAAAAR